MIATTLTLFLILDHYAKRYALQQSNIRLQQLSWQMRDALDRGIHERFIDMRMLATAEAHLDVRNTTGLRMLFADLKTSQPHYAWIGKIAADGKVLVASEGLLEGADVSQRPWFQHARTAEFAGDYHPAVLLEKKLPQRDEPWRFIDVALPLLDAKGQLRGVIGSHLSWGWARDTAARLIDPTQQDYQAQILIVRKDGTVLLGPKELEERKIDAPSLRNALKGQSGSIQERWQDGEFITGYAQTSNDPTSGMGWAILVRQPTSVAMQEFKLLQDRLLIATVFVGLLLALVSGLLAKRLSQPLYELTEAIEHRAMTGDIQPIPLFHAYREVHFLSSTLINLVEQEERQRHALAALNETLELEVSERTAELRATADQLREALSEQEAAKDLLQKMVMLDGLTGLPNRRAFHEELPRAIARSQREGVGMAVLFLDLDGFKGVNDTYGHEAGDELLRQFAARISACVRKTDMVARLAGDEFVIILERLLIDGDANEVGGKILTSMQEAFNLGDAKVTVSSSVGIALFDPSSQQTPDQLVNTADQAMYAAKHAGKNRIHVAPRQSFTR